MTKNEAAKILDVPVNATRQQIDKALQAFRIKYTIQLQYATTPRERDVASMALQLIQDAYYALTGTTAPSVIGPPHAPTLTSSECIPRTTLSEKPLPHQTPKHYRSHPGTGPSKPWSSNFGNRRMPTGSWWAMRGIEWPASEKTVATFICVAMFLAALLILACI